jgi:hypothetical protein
MFKVPGSRFQVPSLRFEVQGFTFKVQGFGLGVKKNLCRTWSAEVFRLLRNALVYTYSLDIKRLQ